MTAHFRNALLGTTGSGKTVSILNMVETRQLISL